MGPGGQTVSAGIKVCPHCGMALAQEVRYCLYCKNQVQDEKKEEEE